MRLSIRNILFYMLRTISVFLFTISLSFAGMYWYKYQTITAFIERLDFVMFVFVTFMSALIIEVIALIIKKEDE